MYNLQVKPCDPYLSALEVSAYYIIHFIFTFTWRPAGAYRIVSAMYVNYRGGSTLGPGGHRPPPNVGQPPPQIFWFQQQKYAFLKSRLFLYSGEINTHIS